MKAARLAYCHLLQEASQKAGRGQSMCSVAFDCADCALFQQHMVALANEREGVLRWTCWRCLEDRTQEDTRSRPLVGFYHSGCCSRCGRAAFLLNAEYDATVATPGNTESGGPNA